jgi:hypothetical protein
MHRLMNFGVEFTNRLEPLWKAWDWLTGARTIWLAWLLFGADLYNDAVTSYGPLDIFFAAGSAVFTTWLLWEVTNHGPVVKGSTLYAEAAAYRAVLAQLAALGVIFVGLGLLVGAYRSAAFNVIFAVMCCAAVADYEGGGKSVLRRAAEKVGETLEAIVPQPGTVGA